MLEVLTYHHIQDVTAMFLNTIMMQCYFNKDLTEKLNLEGNIGFNLRNNVQLYLLN
jgi:hypothetical protein